GAVVDVDDTAGHEQPGPRRASLVGIGQQLEFGHPLSTLAFRSSFTPPAGTARHRSGSLLVFGEVGFGIAHGRLPVPATGIVGADPSELLRPRLAYLVVRHDQFDTARQRTPLRAAGKLEEM